MNIFASHPDPHMAALNLDDKRKNNMIRENCQMLSTACRWFGYEDEDIYKLTHLNHPCNKWVRESRANYFWLCRHTIALLDIFGKQHKCRPILTRLIELSELIPPGPLTTHPNCAANKALGISFHHIEDVYVAYRLYLQVRWLTDKLEPKWELNWNVEKTEVAL